MPKSDVDGLKGYVLEVDFEYPSNLHDAHNDLPLAPHNINIGYNILSSYAKQHVSSSSYNSSKLCQTFLPKTNYVVHIRNLRQYLTMGLKVTKVHRVISFSQRKWLQPYVSYNTNMRALATTSFEKDFFKLMNNAVFGKLMENVRNHTNLELITSEKRLLKVCAKPQYKRHAIF